MTWSSIKSTGSGTFAFALVIEGWPEIFVTDPSLTLTTDRATRTVIAGLLYEGIRFRERAIPREGKYEADAITFKFAPPHGSVTTSGSTDPITQSFARRGVPVAALGATLTATDTTIVLAGSSTLSNSTVYHVGTEAIVTTTSPTIAREQWDTIGQTHSISYGAAVAEVCVYDRPTTADGRRVWLYAYGEGDSRLTLNTDNIVWRGIVSQPPKRDRDGVTWSLYCSHISQALRQSLVVHEAEVKPVGIYHHRLAPMRIQIAENTTSSTTRWLAGFYSTPQDLCTAVNGELDAALTETGTTSTEIAYLKLQYLDAAGTYRVLMRTGSAPPSSFGITIISALIGQSADYGWIRETDGVIVGFDAISANQIYTSPLAFPVQEFRNGASVPALEAPSYPSAALGGPNLLALQHANDLPADDDPIHDYPEWRIYVDSDFDALAADLSIHINKDDVAGPTDLPGVVLGGSFAVTTVDVDGDGNRYIEVDPDYVQAGTPTGTGQWRGYLTGDTVIQPIVDYTDTSASTFTLVDFMAELISNAQFANNGIVPFITGGDFDTTIALGYTSAPAQARTYRFVESVSIEDVLARELLFAGHMLYTTSAGKLAVRPLPVFTDVHITSKTVNGSKIVTPADNYGMWPSFDLHPQGIVATVTVKQGYDPAAGEWNGRTWELRDPDLISRHKKRGVSKVEIAPYSVAFGGDNLELADAQIIGGVLFAFMGREYASVRLEVPFTAFDYLLGDIVTLTSTHVPNAEDGSTGITSKRAVVIGRSWNLDPAQSKWGELELWILLDTISGYAPSAVITAQTNTTGNTWALTCSTANAINVLLSTEGDGQCLAHFNDGDYVRVIQRNSSDTEVTGRISGAPSASGGTCTVNLDGVWTPGVETWLLEPQNDNGSTAQTGQRAYCYVADADKKLATGSFARLFT